MAVTSAAAHAGTMEDLSWISQFERESLPNSTTVRRYSDILDPLARTHLGAFNLNHFVDPPNYGSRLILTVFGSGSWGLEYGESDTPLTTSAKRLAASVDNHSAMTEVVVVRVEIQPALIESVLTEILEIAEYGQDWDGSGAAATTARAVALSNIALYQSMRTTLYKYDIKLHAAPIPDGGLILEWDEGSHRLQIWVHGNGQFSGARRYPETVDGRRWQDIQIQGESDLRDVLESFAAALHHA